MDIIKELKGMKREHNICEDCWYSCPKSEGRRGGGCCDDEKSKDICTCGADWTNNKIDQIIDELKKNGFEAVPTLI
jgi:hypothetical protein